MYSIAILGFQPIHSWHHSEKSYSFGVILVGIQYIDIQAEIEFNIFLSISFKDSLFSL